LYNNWTEFYQQNDPGYVVHTTDPTLLSMVQKIISMGDSFIEWGYGLGYTAVSLANAGKIVSAYDPDINLLPHAFKAREENLKSLKGRVGFTCDKFILKPADIVYSQGLLEHFSNEGIVENIADQLRYAKIAVVFSVPSENYPFIDYGDERRMDIKSWEDILFPFKDRLAQLYYYERRQHLLGVIRCKV
jgi:hypothetical protein